MLHNLLNRLASNPWLWNFLRRAVEGGFAAEKKAIAGELEPWRDAGTRRFLDFGCGTGEFSTHFPPGTYTGIDLAAHYVRFARRYRRGRFGVMDGSRLGLNGKVFDAAMVLGVFHHMPDAMVRGAVVELHRVLRPGGRLLVMEDIPPPRPWNVAGRVMHWLDRGEFIRTDADYRVLLEPEFVVRRGYNARSGICDLAVYVLERAADGVQTAPAAEGIRAAPAA